MDLAIRIHNWELLGAVHTVDFNVENMQILVRHTLIFHTKIHMKCVCILHRKHVALMYVISACFPHGFHAGFFFFSAPISVLFFNQISVLSNFGGFIK